MGGDNAMVHNLMGALSGKIPTSDVVGDVDIVVDVDVDGDGDVDVDVDGCPLR